MDLPSIETPQRNVQLASARQFQRPPRVTPYQTYGMRMESARNAASSGLGHEDLVVKFLITPRDAYRIVFGR